MIPKSQNKLLNWEKLNDFIPQLHETKKTLTILIFCTFFMHVHCSSTKENFGSVLPRLVSLLNALVLVQ